MTERRGTKPLMLHDADCGFCERAAGWVPRLGMQVDDQALQDADLAALAVDPDRALVEMALVQPDGSVVYGHLAWAGILATGPLPHRVIGRVLVARPIEPLSRRFYSWVAANRGHLPGSDGTCGLDSRPQPRA